MASLRRRFWTAAHTEHQSEGLARRSVQSLGIEVYFPQYRERARGGVRRVLPLFERYLLIRLDRRNGWRGLESCRGLRGLLRGADGGDCEAPPSAIPDETIGWIRSLEGADGYVTLEGEEPPAFALHDAVTALRGMFRDTVGEYRGIDRDNQRRASIAFRVLGREIISSVPRYDLARA